MYRFQEQPDGDQIFLSAICPVSYGQRQGALDNTALQLPFYANFYRPVPSNDDPRHLQDHSVPAAIITLIAERPFFDHRILPALGACTVRDQVAGRFTQADLHSFIRASAQTDQTIRFYATYEEFRKTVGTLPRHQELLQTSGIADACENATSGTALSFDPNVMVDTPPPEFTFSMPGALPLEAITLASNQASITGQAPVHIQTAPQQWVYAAAIPILLDRTPQAKRLVHIRGRVGQGRIGMGILNRKANTFQVETFLYPTPTAVDYYVLIPAPEAADDLILRNASSRGVPSEMTVEATAILAPAHQIKPWAHLSDIQLVYDKAAIERETLITVTTAAEQWAYAAAIPLQPSGHAQGVVLQLRARVTRGEIGVAILTSDQTQFVTERRYGQATEPADIVLPLPSSAEGCSLIIRNTAPHATVSQVVLESLETWKLD